MTELELQVTELQAELSSVREAGEGQSDGLRDEQARAMRHVERRLVRLESGRSESEPPSAMGREPEPTEGRRVPPRQHPQLVTEGAEPGEEKVYGDATRVIVEWREARDEFWALLKSGPALATAEAKMRMLKLEIAIIEEHELTVPPASYPWDWEARQDEIRRRQRSLRTAEVDRNRALLRLWVRRVLTLGLWRH